jgi:hypothetical protein
MKDGSRMETRGAWAIEGRNLVFLSSTGVLTSIRLSNVDIEASVAATEASAAATGGRQASAGRAPKARRLVVADGTSRDAGSPTTAESVPPSAAPPGAAGAAADAAPAARLVVEDWQEQATERAGLVVRGTVRNVSDEVAGNLRVTVHLYQGQAIVGSEPAALRKTLVAPGEDAAFVADFEEDVAHERVEFEIEHLAVRRAESAAATVPGAATDRSPLPEPPPLREPEL